MGRGSSGAAAVRVRPGPDGRHDMPIHTIGIDIGSGAVKSVLSDDEQGDRVAGQALRAHPPAATR